jgi:hypothetical protein
MTIIKFLTSEDSRIYIYQVEYCTAEKGKLTPIQLDPGCYLIDVVSLETGKCYNEDLSIEFDGKQVLRRINFADINYDFKQMLSDGGVTNIDESGIFVANGKYVVISENQEIVISPIYDSLTLIDSDLFKATKSESSERSVILGKDGNQLTTWFDYIISTTNDTILLMDGDSIALFSKSQRRLVARYAYPFKNINLKYPIPVKNTLNKFGFISPSGEVLLDFIYDDASLFDEDIEMSWACRYGCYHYINTNGNICTLTSKKDILYAMGKDKWYREYEGYIRHFAMRVPRGPQSYEK